MKKLLKWGGIALVVLIIIGAASGSGSKNESGSTNTESEPTQQANEKKIEETKQHGLNEAVPVGDLAFTVSKVEKVKSLGDSQYTKKQAQGTFYVVSLKIENNGKKTATFDSSMAKIVDDQGREFERSIEGQTAKGMSQGKVDMFLQQIQPSLSVSGDIVFDLPADVTNPKLVAKDSMFSKGVNIKLE